MRGFKLVTVADPAGGNPDAHDLELGLGTFLEIDGIEAAGQEINTRLRFFKGEYFLDLRQGTPYYEEILRKGVDVARVRSIIRQVIESVPGVVDVPRIVVDFDRSARQVTINWEARYQTGEPITSEDFGPLIVEL